MAVNTMDKSINLEPKAARKLLNAMENGPFIKMDSKLAEKALKGGEKLLKYFPLKKC